MLNNKEVILRQLRKLDLSSHEAVLYFELLRGPSTHLKLSRITGINRTKVYRLITQLEQRSLVARRTDDRGTFLVVTDPSTLEVNLIEKETNLHKQRAIFSELIPNLGALQAPGGKDFIVNTYEGYSGLKQMCWHELKGTGDTYSLGNGTIEEISGDPAWAKQHRERQIARGYRSLDLINYNYTTETLPDLASQRLIESKLYDYRVLSPDILTFDSQTVIYDDTVAIYHWKHDEKVGVEIISKSYANMMRGVFKFYWNLAGQQQLT